MDPLIQKHQNAFQDVLDHAQQEAQQLRTGRASPAMVETLMVEAYGAKTVLKGIASISCPDPRSIAIQAWDRSILKDIERALGTANMNVRVGGDTITVVLPMLTEEDRKAMVKVLNAKMEAERIKLRKVREEVREEITKQEHDGSLTEDDKYRLYKELDECVKTYQEKLGSLEGKKEQEIMTV